MKYIDYIGKEYLVNANVYHYSHDYTYSHFSISFFKFSEDGSYKNFSSHALTGFKITCQMDKETPLPYAWRLESEESTLENFEENAKIFSKVKRYLEKYTAENGYPATFGEFVLCIFKALSIDGYTINKDDTYTTSTSEIKGYITRLVESKVKNWSTW